MRISLLDAICSFYRLPALKCSLSKRALPAVGALLFCLMAGCAREHTATKAANPQTITFSEAGVSLILGDDWTSSSPSPDHPLQPPMYVSQAGAIRVVLLPPDRSTPEAVADSLRASFESNPAAAKHTFRRQSFTTDSGVRGICVSYSEQKEAHGQFSEVLNRHYLVCNRVGRGVAINYRAAPDLDSEAVHHSIRTSLALQ